MKNVSSHQSRAFAFWGAILFATGCTGKDESIRFSTDIVALQEMVVFDSVPRSAKWEVFGTPEYTGGVPGPTDYVTLIAEMPPIEAAAFNALPRAGTIWIAPETARAWLSDPFRTTLAQQKNATIDFSTNPHCRAMQATLRQSREVVSGFACAHADNMLVYLTIANYAKT